ncbi:aminotransferase class V-fold PLP-dependent enzyme [Catalinimonas sp. 4WD22]|uniref:aminotransferase class V-fold PLP-dependent enzyme n=1 Tax=Catalinimonas locisalis TaxID=3133978 RepID=UPI003100DE67
MTNWSSIKEQYPATQKYTYLNTPSCGLISKATAECAQQYYQIFLQHGGQERRDWYCKIISLKEKLAEFINAAHDEIALVTSFSVGMNYVVQMLTSLDRVLLLDHDYPSLCLPWQLHEYKLYYQGWEKDGSLNLEKTAAMIRKEKIKVVAVSHVQYQTGYCLDIKALGRICRENGPLLLVDATQSLGAIPHIKKLD